ncbi:hypothetical protein RGQ29_031724 [Quercus rubra]|uniref:Uncharacterized protein n=1 Tax=Quercus rubra TaxID=3512 RepID=A0AAN7EL33_QUERU|nr:hypothetical protein RGQ29_031724 [Quercus rubra]
MATPNSTIINHPLPTLSPPIATPTSTIINHPLPIPSPPPWQPPPPPSSTPTTTATPHHYHHISHKPNPTHTPTLIKPTAAATIHHRNIADRTKHTQARPSKHTHQNLEREKKHKHNCKPDI